MSDYITTLDYLYQQPGQSNMSATAKPAYFVDQLLHDYVNTPTSFQTNLPIDYYFYDITNVEMVLQNGTIVDQTLVNSSTGTRPRIFSSPTATTSSSSTCTTSAASAGSTTTPTIEDVSIPTTERIDVDAYDVKINVTNSTTITPSNINQLASYINERVSLFGNYLKGTNSSTNNSSLNDILNTSTHKEVNEYMSEINNTISTYMFRTAYTIFSNKDAYSKPSSPVANETVAQQQVRTENDRIKIGAVTNIRSLMVPWKLDPLIRSLRENSKTTMYAIFEKFQKSPGTKQEAKNFIKAFSSRNDMVNNTNYKKYYYQLRTEMIATYRIPSDVYYENDKQIDYFMRKILIDFYIKMCYPLIHYDFIDTLMMRYIKLGDFVNARFALLAKCIFTLNMVAAITTAGTDIPSPVSTDINTNINAYIERNNKGDISYPGTTNEKLKDIVIELHELSNKVTDNSQKGEILKDAIRNNQLTMRSLSQANIDKEAEVQAKFIEFVVILVVLGLVIVACAVLLFFDKVDIAAMVAAGFLAIVLCYKAVLMIIDFIKKN